MMIPRVARKPADHPLGYIVALSGMLMQLMSYGIDNSYSIFSEDMHNDASLGYPSVTAISFGNSVSLGLSPAFGVLAGFLVDRVPPPVMMAASTLLLFAGLWISSSFATSVTAVTLTYCLMASISSACMLSPGAAATSSWFRRYQGLAMGINFCGGGLGSAIIPPLLGKWVVAYGWRHTFRLMSAFCAIGVAATLMSSRRIEPTNGEEGAGGTGPGEEEEDGSPEAEGENLKKESKAGEEARENAAAAVDNDNNNNAEEEEESEEGPRSLHTHRLTPWELFLTCFTCDFIGNFLCWTIFSWAFYSLIYSTVPYVSSMGKPGTVYANELPIPTDVAASLFTFYGIFQIVGSVAVGYFATLTTDEFAYIICASVGGLFCGFLALCRTYAAFAAMLCVIGFCMAGMFAVMPVLIAKRLHGPNLGFYMGSVFLAGVIGGFSAPPIQAELQQRNNGNYSYVCVFMSVCMTAAAAVCYIFMWDNKRLPVVRGTKRTS